MNWFGMNEPVAYNSVPGVGDKFPQSSFTLA